MESAIFGSSQVQSLGAWNYFLSFPEQFPQVLKAGNSIYMKFEHKKNIQPKLICCELQLPLFTAENFRFYNIIHYCHNVKTKEKKTI